MSKKYAKLIRILSTLLLFLYAFRNVNQGIDVTDTGYHFSNFMYMSNMDPMWIFSTYLASVWGHILTLLPWGDTLLGMNIYATVIPAVSVVVSYVFFVKSMKLPMWKAFVGGIIALSLCWCPATCIYNYMTYLFFSVGAILLYLGLRDEKKSYMVFAGMCLGINVLVRFPNAAEATLILVVWYVCFLKKAPIKEYVQKTGYCLLGYLLGIGMVLLQICMQYGLREYVDGIVRLFAMTETASDYTMYAMIINLLNAYLFSGKWFVIIGICTILGYIGFAVFPNRFTKIKMIGYACCCAILFRWFYGQGMFSLAYDGFGAVLNWGVIVIIGALVLALWIMAIPKYKKEEKILSSIVILVIAITPLGSNNQLYANLNNMFLIAPYVFWALQKLSNHQGMAHYPFKIMTRMCLAMIFVQCFIFGNVYIFRDMVPRTHQVTNIPAVQYMRTNEQNAEELQALGSYVKDADLTGKRVILFGDVPALSAYLKMPFVMSPWPDLPSYTQETFEKELKEVRNHIAGERPIIIFGAEFYEALLQKEHGMAWEDVFQSKYGFKMDMLHDMIKEENYKCTFKNSGYAILE